MVEPTKPDAVVAAERLTASMESLTTEMRALRVYGKRNRHLIWMLGAAFAVNLVLAVVVGGVGVTAHRASDRARKAVAAADANASNQRATCLAGNEARKVQVDLWNFVLSSEPESQQTNEFHTYIDKVFAQRQC